MSRVALHFPRWAKRVLYGNVALSFVTGSLWFALHRWGQVEGEFGPEKHPLEPWLIKAHGASAFLVLIGFGYLLASHVHIGWRSGKNRRAGLAVVGTILGLIFTGYLLYYAGSEGFRESVSWVHLAIGLSLPGTLGFHIWLGHRARTKR